jgi:hypothetical protein
MDAAASGAWMDVVRVMDRGTGHQAEPRWPDRQRRNAIQTMPAKSSFLRASRYGRGTGAPSWSSLWSWFFCSANLVMKEARLSRDPACVADRARI